MGARWGDITAGEILSPIQGELVSGSQGVVFRGLSTDSREISGGVLFWALKGERYDGHDFLGQALEKGAAGVVVEGRSRVEIPSRKGPAVIRVSDTLKALGDLASWWRHQHGARVIAITGSVGKTTTKEMAAGILERGGLTLKNKGNFNNLIGLPLTLFGMEEGHRRAVLEMGMNRPGEIARLTEITDPDIGLITNVARVHLEGLGDIEGVARAKTELLDRISPEAEVILNGDDELLMKAASAYRRRIITYGMGPDNDIRAAGVEGLGSEGISFELRYRGDVIPARVRVPGFQNVYNALAASSIAFRLEEPVESIVGGLNAFKGIQGRFMLIHLPGGATLVDDTYNSNPSSLRAALESLQGLAGSRGRVIVGLGEMMELGDETVPAHREAGGMVADMNAHYFLAMGEHAREMIKGAVKRGYPRERAEVVGDHIGMVEKIRDVMREGDLILLKGSRRMGLEKVADGLKQGPSKETNHGIT
jgi:UDP-N-acetylmuramoyl-tripeptide--D-alanyl-D-alanine ligase